MRLTNTYLARGIRWVTLAWLVCAVCTATAQVTPFSFTLDEPCKTSAGVFALDGTLIRTLWSKVSYAAGTNTTIWDGLDDYSNLVPAGPYQIKLLQHNTEYVWDGAIGNTSSELSGPTVHTGFWPMEDMTITGTNAFYVSGYNEGGFDFRNFNTTDPQRLKARWGAGGISANIYDPSWNCLATDGNWVYFGCYATLGSAGLAPGCITAYKVGDNSITNFINGVIVTNASNPPFPGIYIGVQPGLTGLAVQQDGNLLAVAVAPDNNVYLLDKQSGAAIKSFNVTSPSRMSFSPDGSLWLISGNNVICYTNLNDNPSVAVTISSLTKPLAVAVNPMNSNLILVADGGSSQQVKAFDGTGTSLWTFGLAGGYQTNGAAVATNKLWFYDGQNDGTFLCFAPDGSFWIGDGGNYRTLHLSAACNYLEQIMYQPHSYRTCVDQNNPSRVFNQFLEFKVDYSKPLPQAWTLVNNWKVGVDHIHISQAEGLYEVTTFTNGRTYALIDNNLYSFATLSELVELDTNQIRFTGNFPAYGGNARGWTSLGPDGSARRSTIGFPTWYETTLNSFDANNNPVWNPETLIASAPAGATDPFSHGFCFGNIRATISTDNVLITFDQTLNNGWHLGGIRVGGTNWLWKASPAGDMNGRGNYEIGNGVQYGGNTLQAVDRQVIYGYHGEFFRHSGQACQHMHFFDDGLFIGQFGEANVGHYAQEGAVPGCAGNAQSPNLIKTDNGDYYLWVNDESSHGPQRWHLVNARNIREQTGVGTLGSAITLTNDACEFAVGLTGKDGNQSVELSWQPVANATLYNIYYSLLNGGPYNLFAGSTTNLSYVASGLTNGQTYYFVVTAVQSDKEGIPSEQIVVHPIDTSQTVFCAGSMSEAGQAAPMIDVSSSAPGLGFPSYVGAEHLTGLLNLRELDDYGFGNLANETVGTKGYFICNWGGFDANRSNILPPLTLTPGSGWSNTTNLERQVKLDSFVGTADGWSANPVGSISIGANDNNFHYLTIVSPAQANPFQPISPRKFILKLTSANGASAQYSVDEAIGYSHVFQFLFKGNVTLQADATGGSGAIVKALFLDDAFATNAPWMPATYLPNDITNGLVADYPLAINGMDNCAKNDLTLIGAPAFSSNAVNWNATIPTLGYSSPQQWPQSGLTISAWIKMADPAAVYSIAACYGNYFGPLNQAYFQFYTALGGLNARVIQNCDANYIGRKASTGLSSSWHFVAFTWSGETNSSSLKIYLDGVRSDDGDNQLGAFSRAYAGSDVPLVVGDQLNVGAGFVAPFNGGEKKVRMYDRALSPSEIGTLYTNGLNVVATTNIQLNSVSLTGSQLVLSGSNGHFGQIFYILASTNLAQPLSQWTPVATNVFGAAGNFTVTNEVNPKNPQQLFILKSQ